MSLYRRDFLRALASGTGAILMGRHWYRQGTGLLVPEPPTIFVNGYPLTSHTFEWDETGGVVLGSFAVYSYVDFRVRRADGSRHTA